MEMLATLEDQRQLAITQLSQYVGLDQINDGGERDYADDRERRGSGQRQSVASH